MVEVQLRRRGIHDVRVLAAMESIPREEFVPSAVRVRAYADSPLPIGCGQTISQPYITALMAQSLHLMGTERVLEVGAGSGYHAAVLAMLSSQVIAVEVLPELAAYARGTLRRLGFGGKVSVVCGDGSCGWPDGAPYAAISVAAASPIEPLPLLDQLADPGRLVIPVGTLEDQDLRLITKREGKWQSVSVTHCRFVPLVGEHGWRPVQQRS